MSVINLDSLMNKIQDVSSNEKIEKYMKLSGVQFWKKGLIKKHSVNLVAVGGIPAYSLDMNMVSIETKRMMGLLSSQSYLSYSPDNYNKIVVGFGHSSSAHAVSVSLLVSGISCSVENEFNSQRDLIHLSRITEARTSIQDEPPYVCLDEEYLEDYEKMREYAISLRKKYNLKKGNKMEALNLIHSKASGTSFVLTGSLRNLQKLLGGITDNGKEKEYRDVLSSIKENLQKYWMELF